MKKRFNHLFWEPFIAFYKEGESSGGPGEPPKEEPKGETPPKETPKEPTHRTVILEDGRRVQLTAEEQDFVLRRGMAALQQDNDKEKTPKKEPEEEEDEVTTLKKSVATLTENVPLKDAWKEELKDFKEEREGARKGYIKDKQATREATKTVTGGAPAGDKPKELKASDLKMGNVRRAALERVRQSKNE